MFSKKTVVIAGLAVLIVLNIIFLSFTSKRPYHWNYAGQFTISLVAPFQKAVNCSIHFAEDIWKNYFYLVSAAKENSCLKRKLNLAIEKNNRCYETDLSNIRLRKLLNFRKTIDHKLLASEVIGKDPSLWFKTVIIDKGRLDGIEKGLPVIVPEGIVGQIIHAADNYSKVLLIIDRNSAVDAVAQRTRARGIITGEDNDRCGFKYVLSKHDIHIGDTIISSGLDGVFPKGFLIGKISKIVKNSAGIFQEVAVIPYVDFEIIEEVFVILNPQKYDSLVGQ